MQYSNVIPARFLSRPNRFIARVELEGQVLNVHVKNTGRCAELLRPGCTVYLQPGDNPARKTPYDLIAVDKAGLLVNMDSAAPNQAVAEWLAAGGIGPLDELRAEYKLGASRFDFFARRGEEKILMEVKGCTLEDGGFARFPDAPTLRGVKHLEELAAARRAGYEAAVCFLVQMEGMRYLEPNDVTHPQFGDALRRAAGAGVEVLAMECAVTPEELRVVRPLPVRL